jgi:two-component system response regulator HydG
MARESPRLLVVDRDGDATRALVAFLRQSGYDVDWTRDGADALAAIQGTTFDGVVAAIRAPGIDGLAVLKHARLRNPSLCAVLVSERPDIEPAVEAVREGAHDVQTRPVHHERLLAVLERGLRDGKLAARVEEMERRLDERFGLDRLSGRSRAISRVMEQMSHVAPTQATVLIEGESGTGKGLVARAIHQNSPRKRERFVWLHCGALGAHLLDAELFGRERSEDAEDARPGRLELAAGGTLFLDAVDELPPALQVKLLRAMQERTFERVGGREPLRFDARVIAASNRELAAEVRVGRFRDDLYQRLSVAQIAMPPLRQRREDIPMLVDAFVREFNREHHRRVKGVSPGALERLVAHDWPGNVRELKGAVESMVLFAAGRHRLEVSDLPEPLRKDGRRALALSVGMSVAESERILIEATLRHTGHDKRRSAKLLGIGLRTLYRKIQAYGIE